MDMIFGEGPILSGHWYNPSTGDSFTVRDTYFEDNNLFVITTDGRRLNYDIISKYVQSDKPLPKQPSITQNTQQSNIPNDILSEIVPTQNDNNDLLLPEDLALINNQQPAQPKNLGNIHQQQTFAPQQSVISEDEMLINRILKRTKGPQVEFTISWPCFPEKQIEMLDMMAIEPEDIAEYYIKELSTESIVESIKQLVRKVIMVKLAPQEPEEAIAEKPNEVIAEEIKESVVKKLPKTKNKQKTKK